MFHLHYIFSNHLRVYSPIGDDFISAGSFHMFTNRGSSALVDAQLLYFVWQWPPTFSID